MSKSVEGYDLTLLYQYFWNKQVRADNDLTQLINNLTLRESDPLDYLEIIMAQTRKAVVEEISREAYILMRAIMEG